MHIIKAAAALLMIASGLHANTLIITRGPVCRNLGTVLGNAIHSIDSSYKIVRQNDVFQDVHYTFLKRMFPDQMNFLESAIEPRNVVPAIWKSDIYFKDDADSATILQAWNIIEEIQRTLTNIPQYDAAITIAKKARVISELASYAAGNDNVVWETGVLCTLDEDAAQIKDKFNVVFETITYCSPETIIEGLLIRNFDADCSRDASNKKLVREALTSFFMCFQLAGEDYQNGIMLTRDDFNDLMQKSACYIRKTPEINVGDRIPFVTYEFSPEELEAFRNDLYEQFNFDEVDRVVLTPAIPYDVLLHGKEECLQFAREFLGYQ
jgi:hypothetical protein